MNSTVSPTNNDQQKKDPHQFKRTNKTFNRNQIIDESKLTQEDYWHCEETRSKLCQKHNGLAWKIAHSFSHDRQDAEEYYCIALEGLTKALNTYEVDRDTLFSTFAYKVMQNEVLQHIRETLRKRNGVMCVSLDAEDIAGNEKPHVSMDALLHKASLLYGDEKDPSKNPFLNLELQEYLQQLFEDLLTKDEQVILCYHYGLFKNSEITQLEIGETLSVSQGQVSKIEKLALNKLKDRMIIDGMDFEGVSKHVGNRVVNRILQGQYNSKE